jgi:hypothetical protein
VQEGEECSRLGREDLAVCILDGAVDGHTFVDGLNAGHGGDADETVEYPRTDRKARVEDRSRELEKEAGEEE